MSERDMSDEQKTEAGKAEQGAAAQRAAAARRRFLLQMAGAAGGAALVGLGLGVYSRQAAALPAFAVRPPGALPEDTLGLAELGDGVATGTPYFRPRNVPCEMCPDIPCVKACPTGALDHELTEIDKARMGLAVLVDQETCLNFQGLRCDVCYRICPLIDKAITLEPRENKRTGKHAMFIPVVHSNACTGCGKCERACVLESAAIKVMPIHQAKGELGRHYRLGWKEKEKAGRSLLPQDTIELPVRRPGGGL